MARDGRGGLFAGIAMVAVAALPLMALYTFMSMKLGEDFFIPTMIVGGIVTAIVLRGPVGKALARRIEENLLSRRVLFKNRKTLRLNFPHLTLDIPAAAFEELRRDRVRVFVPSLADVVEPDLHL